MHIYPLQMDPPVQLSIDALNTPTSHLADGSPSINHRCLEYC